LICTLLIVLPVILLVGAWRLGGVSALEDDLIYYLPIRQYIGECIRIGEFPLWNPYIAMGTSIAADPQSGLWYPPTYLFVILPALVAYPLTIVLHFALAGGGMYRFLRACRHDWRAALLGAIAFEFCGYLIAHRAHLTIHQAVAWLPWMLYAWRRFADTGFYQYFALASVAFGVQMLVQHVQISLICATLLTGYVLVVLLPKRSSLLWQYPAGMAIGVMLSGVQLLPTWLHYANSVRGSASYHLFVENSWLPSSSLIWLFPMLFGSRTPNLWSQPWWCWSHFCEQSVYASILILVLAGASFGLLRRSAPTHVMDSHALTRRLSARAENRGSLWYWNREVAFWWIASLVALVIALGRFTPISNWLFHVPIYRSLRVPARWMLVWSVALPVLASMTVSAVLRGDEFADRIARAVRLVATRILPLVAGVCLAVMAIVRWRVDQLAAYFQWRPTPELWMGMKSAIRPGNPAIWWPILLMMVTGWIVVRWSRTRRNAWFVSMFAVFLVDLASVASFVDVDTRMYRLRDLREPAPLAKAIRKLKPRPGDRLLVPRSSASYDWPLEVLWPQSNLRAGIATFNGYGPFQPVSHRLLFRFQPWGSSEDILSLLRNTDLCRAMGIRFVAVRSEREREIITQALLPAGGQKHIQPISKSSEGEYVIVHAGRDILWPLNVNQPGIYTLTLDIQPMAGLASRCFIRLETPEGAAISDTRSIDPVDLSFGTRRMRFLFYCNRAPGPAFVRIKSERGDALAVGTADFSLVAADAEGKDPSGAAQNPLVHRADLPGNVSLYEIPDACELVRWAKGVETVSSLRMAVDQLQNRPEAYGLPDGIVVEWPEDAGEPPVGGDGPIAYDWPIGHELRVATDSLTDGIVVFNQSYDPGWRATVNGHEVPIFRVNAVVQGVAIPAAQCRVVFRYRPCGLMAGGGASLAAIFLLFAGLVSAYFRNRGR